MDVTRVAKALSDPLRFQILKRIAMQGSASHRTSDEYSCEANTGLCVCELVEGMGLMQSKVSYHLKELKEAGLVREENRGKWNYYSLKKETLDTYLTTLQGELFM
ncbi:ArsR/SmtB family transcription factor [Heliophilum fasciatum]|uniref:ArsR family transcriptional regulator n=1 Tax=Heliophilum fasciatum TaxID=35700 RepID=A0A4R2RIB8_9FIRM|nr:metalloregulator ArsR/SmtB family transcription factor [Heliophilum fasciatum]MCW2278565.1 ArsR family transcriptional regulator [Heliophilum fasciatum]TCP63520.1 ArsR family transcriptional regulator [Heliophilum fasciatum]